jgi:choline/carnitine/betaine transport
MADGGADGVLTDGNNLGNGGQQAYVPSTSNLNASGEINTNQSNSDINTTNDNEQGRSLSPHDDNEENEFDDPSSRTCGCLPRVIKGQLLGTEDGWSIDFYMNPSTMAMSIIIIWSFVIWCAVDEDSGTEIAEWQAWIVKYWTWFYVFGLVCMGSFITFMLFSRFGDIKLGPKDEPPRFSMGSWFAMLFSAGVGVGLYFYGVAEPIWHYYGAKNGENRYYTDGDNLEKALDAMNISWFHWGLTASSVYCVVGLPLAYFTHVKNAPLKFSSAFVPLLGKKYANGFIGDLIDTFAVVGTMFGVATSLGLGVIQLNAFLSFMDPDYFANEDTVEDQEDFDTNVRLVTIWIITLFATISVFTGLDVGIRRLSEGNFVFCLILLFYLFFVCDPFYLTNLFIQTAGYHVQHLLEITFFTDAFQQAGFTDGNDSYESFMSWWTVFYWGWWIAWSPFVGIFIAQISRGRTIKEFIIGNMFVPTLFTSIWLTIFGGVGLYSELAFDGMTGNASVDNTSVCDDPYMTYRGNKVAYLECFGTATMLFEMIDRFPLGPLMNVLAGIGIVTYFVTSSDSASHVIDVLTANGNEEPPKIQRIFWALSEGAVASVLLSIGGSEALSALQTVSIASGLPFCGILLFLCYAFYYALRVDTGEIEPDMRNHWKLDFFDSANPQIVCFENESGTPPKREYFYSWFRGLVVPCVENYRNYNNAVGKDVNERVFSSSQGTTILWLFMLFVPAICVFIFLIIGIWFDGWPYVAIVLYCFYFSINAWQRSKIRELYGIDGNIFTDICAHFLCCGAWAIAQEGVQIMEGDTASYNSKNNGGSPRGHHVADESNANVELTTQAPGDNEKSQFQD